MPVSVLVGATMRGALKPPVRCAGGLERAPPSARQVKVNGAAGAGRKDGVKGKRANEANKRKQRT